MKSKSILYIVLAILLVGLANAAKYFVLDVNYIAGSLTFNSVNLREADREIKHTDKSGFLVKIVSFRGLEIKKIYYNISENRNYLIHIPYDENAASIEVYNARNSKIMDIDVSSFANTCGNNKCEEHESYESCTRDCSSGSKDDFCDELKDGVCDLDCSVKTDVDCEISESEKINESVITKTKQEKVTKEPKEKPNYLMWILLALSVIIFVLLFLFIKKRKESQVIDSLRDYISENIRRGFTLQQIKDVLYREGYNEKEIGKAVKSIGS